MRRVQLGGTPDLLEPFVLSEGDFEALECAGKIELAPAARSSLQIACETFLKSSVLVRPKEADVRALLVNLEAGLKKTSSALNDLTMSNTTSETASVWLRRNWSADVQPEALAHSARLALASVQKALRLIFAGPAKGPSPNPAWENFFFEIERIHKDAGGGKTLQNFTNAVIDALPRWVRDGYSPDRRAQKQRRARSKREAKRHRIGDK